MNSEQKGKEIILNDTFQTKRVNLYKLMLAGTDYQSKGSQIEGKEILTYQMDDLRDINIENIEFEKETQYGYYNYDVYHNPNSSRFGRWNTSLANYDDDFGYSITAADCNVLQILKNPSNSTSNIDLASIYPGLRGAIFLSDSSNGATLYFSKKVPALPESADGLTGISKCIFTIGLLPIKTNSGNSPEFLTSTCISIDKAFFKNNSRFSHQSSFISHGYGSEGYGNYFTFRSYCKNSSESDSDKLKWEVYVYEGFSENSTHNDGTPVKLDDNTIWDGLSFITFYSELIKNSDGTLTRILYFYNNKNEKRVVFNSKSNGINDVNFKLPSSIFYNKIIFGGRDNKYFSCLVVKDILYCPDTKYEYTSEPSDSAIKNFVSPLIEQSSSEICSTTPYTVYWDYIGNQLDDKDESGTSIKKNGSTTYPATNSNPVKAALSNDLFTVKNKDKCIIFSSKNKQVTIESVTGGLTQFSANNRNIYNINCKQLSNLSTINLSNNLLESLDLSDNYRLTNINVAQNKPLHKLILPTVLEATLLTINVSGCENLTEIVFPIKQLGGKTINLIIDNTIKLNTLQVINFDSNNLTLTISGDITGITDNISTLTLQNVNCQNLLDIPVDYSNNSKLSEINISGAEQLKSKSAINNFFNVLPTRVNKKAGRLYMYGKRYNTTDAPNGDLKAIKDALNIAVEKNWLFFL